MTDIGRLRRELVGRILDSDATAPRQLRRAAFEGDGLDEPLRTLVDKVANHANEVTDDDVGAVRDSGLSEDQIFEIMVCAAVGRADRDYSSALTALAAAIAEGDTPK